MIGTEHLQTIVGSNAVDSDGDKLGKIGNVYLDDRTGEPAWATVNTGLFGTKESFVPLATARIEGDQLVVPFDKAKVKDAPKVTDDGHIGDDEQEELYRYYGLSSANGHDGNTADYAGTTDAGTYADSTTGVDTSGVGTSGVRSESGFASGDEAGTVGHDTSGPTTDNAMTRSEEQLHVGTETREERPGPPAQVRRHRAGDRHRPRPARGGPDRARADHRRQPSARRSTARRSPRRSTRSCCTRSAPWSRRRPCRSSACASTRRR